MIITTTVEIQPRRIADLMVTAIEGGIRYWCKSVKLLHHDAKLKKPWWYDDEKLYADGSNFTIEVVELDPSSDGRKDGVWLMNLASMEEAFKKMQTFGEGTSKGYCWHDFMNENEDGITADVWFQLAVFGEVVYG